MTTTYSPRPKWGIVSIAFLSCAFLVGALFVFRNEKEILALYRHQLTPAELQQIAHYQYQSEHDDRLHDLRGFEEQLQRQVYEIDRLKAEHCEQGETIVGLQQRVATLEGKMCVMTFSKPYSPRPPVVKKTPERALSAWGLEQRAKQTPEIAPSAYGADRTPEMMAMVFSVLKRRGTSPKITLSPDGKANILYFKSPTVGFAYFYAVDYKTIKK